ncbi:DUF2147 domain-containing protein [Pedobacter immunditicola]|uniref:DUF2147 domain-containing protein n=1 Tax=Pedobacter immunditicola TaxID=3133440 RepID=UPI0030B6B5B4
MKRFSILLLLITFSFMAYSQNKDAILGRWVNATGEAHIDIHKKGDKYFGKIVWLKNPRDEKGKEKTDYKNPDRALTSRPILGLEILRNFKYEEGKWKGGKIYDPKTGKTYSCTITSKGTNLIDIRGYIGISLIGRSETWKRIK